MSNKQNNQDEANSSGLIDRRQMLKAGITIAAASLLPLNNALAGKVNRSNVGSKNAGRFPQPKSPERRKLGSLEVSSVGMGIQNMHRKFNTTVPYRPEMIKIIQAAYGQGITFFDCAEAYGPHENERILGEAIRGFRDKVVITSKFGWNIDPKTGARGPGLNSKPEHIKLAVEGMLKRLRTDRIDLLYQHRVDPEVPIEDVAGAVKDLINQGKVLHWGLSEPGLQTIRRAHAELPLTAIQNEYSMIWRGPEKDVIPVCEELGIGFVPWWPLACQLLTGWIDANTRFAQGDIRGRTSRYSPENLPHNLKLVDLIKKWAVRKQASPAQISIAWLLAQKPWIVPIPGTTNMAHMKQNSNANNVRFTRAEIVELNTAVKSIEIKGQRLPDQVLAFSGVEAPPKK